MTLLRREWVAVLAAVAIATAWSTFTAGSAQAHARYDSSTPGQGEILEISPPAVEITFTQEIQRISGTYDITVERDRGALVTSGLAVVNDTDRTTMSVPLQPGLTDGRYVVRWKNVSDADGDAAEGAFSFYINHQPTTIDLENDAELALIGAEDETPAASDTPGAADTPAAGSTESGAATPSADATATVQPIGGPKGDVVDDDDNTSILVIVGVVIVVALAVIGGLVFVARRSA